MRQARAVIDKVSVMRANSRSKDMVDVTLQRAEKLKADPDKKDRLSKALCLSCYYIYTSRMGGAAITSRPCGICEKEMTFSSTATDVVCGECAKASQLCCRCGADIDLKNRRNRVVQSINGVNHE